MDISILAPWQAYTRQWKNKTDDWWSRLRQFGHLYHPRRKKTDSGIILRSSSYIVWHSCTKLDWKETPRCLRGKFIAYNPGKQSEFSPRSASVPKERTFALRKGNRKKNEKMKKSNRKYLRNALFATVEFPVPSWWLIIVSMRVLASAMVKNISNKLHPSVNKNPPLWDTKAGLVSGCSRPAQFWKQTRLTFDTSHQLPEEDPPFFWGGDQRRQQTRHCLWCHLSRHPSQKTGGHLSRHARRLQLESKRTRNQLSSGAPSTPLWHSMKSWLVHRDPYDGVVFHPQKKLGSFSSPI